MKTQHFGPHGQPSIQLFEFDIRNLVDGYRLTVDSYLLPVVGCRLSVVGCQLTVAGCRVSWWPVADLISRRVSARLQVNVKAE